MNNTLREFFNDHKTEIENKQYVKVYEDLYDLDMKLRGEFSKVLDSVGINPLLYMEKIPEASFEGLSPLKFVRNPKFNRELKVIEEVAFFGRKDMDTVILPPSLISIGNHAFATSSVRLVRSIGSGDIKIGDWVFDECVDLEEVDLSSNKWGAISTGVFCDCARLERILLPQSIERIPPRGFKGCKSLRSIQLPDGLRYVGMEAFQGCESLESVRIPETIQRIRPNAFDRCDRLKEIHFGGSEESFINTLHDISADRSTIDMFRNIDVIFEK